MTEFQKFEYLLQGLTAILLESHSYQNESTPQTYLSTAVKYEQAREAAENRDWKPIIRQIKRVAIKRRTRSDKT